MSRLLLPRLFEMGIVPITTGMDQTQRTAIQNILGINFTQDVIPVALRWRLHPSVGVPRMPFEVWRRSRPGESPLPLDNLQIPSTVVSLSERIEWGRTPCFEVRLQAQPGPNQTLTVQALDDQAQPIVGEQVSTNSQATIRFRAANICALQVIGEGTVSDCVGVIMVNMANDPGWVHVETVGLPVNIEDSQPHVYDSIVGQGLPFNLKPGLDAALDRLRVGEVFYTPPPATLVGGLPPPDWPAPDPSLFMLQELRAQPGPVQLILQMLEQVDPSNVSATQADYVETMTVPGMRQPGQTPASDPVEIDLPVAAMTLMSTATDMWSALGLGFGTTDFAPDGAANAGFLEPSGPSVENVDYMVTFNAQLPFGFNVELAALASVARFAPPTPMNFKTGTWLRNRPPERDAPISYDVELQWRRPPQQIAPHGYALGIIDAGGDPQVLNEPRPSNGFALLIPVQAQQGDRQHEEMANDIDHLRIAPLTGTRQDTYMGAALDVFGRWSEAWAVATYDSIAPGPSTPLILNAELHLAAENATGRAVPATLEIELVWDWEDRSPHQLELVGQFYTGSPDALAVPIGIEISASGRLRRPLILQFTGDDIDQTPTANSRLATVERLPSQPTDDNARRYKVVLPGFRVDFTNASRATYAVYARGSEQVNAAVFSDFTAPASATAIDPLPAEPPVLEDEPIHWTALPDATGIARYRLTFPTVPHASGYVIYEATEAAMIEAAGLQPLPEQDIHARAAALAAIAGQEAVRDTYARLNRALLAQPSIDLELPGAVSGFYAYRVSDVTAEQVESELSNPILVAVPRRSTPGAPMLQVRTHNDTVNIRIEPGAGPAPHTVELYRTQSSLLITDLDIMGPPIANRTADITAGQERETSSPVFEIEDQVSPSWFPHYYRAVAFGQNQTSNGIFPGRSEASVTMQAILPPSAAPELQELAAELVTRDLAQVHFRSAAEVRQSPLGNHRVTVGTMNLQTVPIATTKHVQADLSAIADRSGSTNGSPVVGVLTRGDLDSDGRWLYETYVPVDDNRVSVRLTDPMGRTTELSLTMPDASQPTILSTTRRQPEARSRLELTENRAG